MAVGGFLFTIGLFLAGLGYIALLQYVFAGRNIRSSKTKFFVSSILLSILLFYLLFLLLYYLLQHASFPERASLHSVTSVDLSLATALLAAPVCAVLFWKWFYRDVAKGRESSSEDV